VQAAIRLKAVYWRDKRPDTVVYAPETDSVPTPVLQAARACASRFNVATVPVRDLLSLMQLYLWIRQDDLAQAVADRWLKAESNQPALRRGWTLQLIASAYLAARPTRRTAAAQYLARLDSLGAPTAAWRLMAHTKFAQYAMSVDEIAAAITDGVAALAASKQMTRSDRIDRAYDILDGYAALAEPTAIHVGGRATLALFDTASADLLPLRGPGTKGASEEDAFGSAAPMRRAGEPMIFMAPPPPLIEGAGSSDGASDQMMLKQRIAQFRMPYTVLDTIAPLIRASHWYNTGSDTGARPKPGVVTLLVRVTANNGGIDYPRYASLRRLYGKFHASGLQLILYETTFGYFRNQPTPSPAVEAEKDRGYLFDFLKLPGVLAVNETSFGFRADRFRINAIQEVEKDYFRNRGAVVIGKNGTIRMIVNLDPDRERAVDAVIAAELAR
jgi:hypothetical protein